MSTIRKAIDGLDTSGETGLLQKEILESLYETAEKQAEIFMLEIMDSMNGDKKDRKIPVTSLVAQSQDIRVMTSKSTADIQKTVSQSLDSFLSGASEVVKGIEKLLSGALTVFLGESVAHTSKMEKYYILTEGISTVRFDVKCWYRSVESKSIYSRAEKVSCVVGTKSVVDFSKIDLSTFTYLYQDQLSRSGIKGDDLENEIKKVKEIYKEFHENIELDDLPKNSLTGVVNYIMPGM